MERARTWRLPLVELIAGAAVAAVSYLLATRLAPTSFNAFLQGRRQDLYAALLGIHTTLLGFALATLTVVLGYAQSSRFQVLRDSGWFSALFSVFTRALWTFTVAFIVTLGAILIDHEARPLNVFPALVAGTTTAALATLVHLLWTLGRVVKVVGRSAERPPGSP